MKCLSIRQPWAWCIFHGGKDIENRTWSTSVRGRIFVHAAKTVTRGEFASAQMSIELKVGPHITLPAHEDLVKGAIIGTVDIVDCARTSISKWYDGQFGFVLSNPVAFNMPIPYKGKLGFFEVDYEQLAERLIFYR